jgi:hypothetical protein
MKLFEMLDLFCCLGREQAVRRARQETARRGALLVGQTLGGGKTSQKSALAVDEAAGRVPHQGGGCAQAAQHNGVFGRHVRQTAQRDPTFKGRAANAGGVIKVSSAGAGGARQGGARIKNGRAAGRKTIRGAEARHRGPEADRRHRDGSQQGARVRRPQMPQGAKSCFFSNSLLCFINFIAISNT